MITRRHVLASVIAAPAILRFAPAQAATTLKISHQFPGGTIDKGDFRDRLTRKFAEEITKRSGGELLDQAADGITVGAQSTLLDHDVALFIKLSHHGM